MTELKEGVDFFNQTIPVFLDYAPRITTLAQLADENQLAQRSLVPDTFTSGEHLVVAQGFALRTVFPVIGKDCPDLSTENSDYLSICQRHMELLKLLQTISPHDFKGSSARDITHTAGDAQITQPASEYVNLFGLPNFFFHFTMAYATLRAAGVTVGKAQFDGLHQYAPGFSFQHT